MRVAVSVEHVHETAVAQEERAAVRPVAECEENPVRVRVDLDARGDDVAGAHRRKDVLGHGRAARLEHGAVLGAVRRAVHRAGPADEGVVEREHVVALGLGPPRVDQLLQALGFLGREVARLGEVVGQVEEQPVVLVEHAAALDVVPLDRELPADVIGRRLPSLVVDRAAPEHLEVLRRAGRGCRRVGERGEQRLPVDRLLVDAVDRRRPVRCRRRRGSSA